MRDINKRFTSDEDSERGRPKTHTHKWECFKKLRMYEQIGTVDEFKELKSKNITNELSNKFTVTKSDINSDLCPMCGSELEDTMIPNDYNDERFGCQIFGVICSNCGFEHYDNED